MKCLRSHLYMRVFPNIYIYIYIYMCVCVCVCVCVFKIVYNVLLFCV